MLRAKSPGVTLIEMAMVLVIIGLILAAVMKGSEIYHSAQVSRVNKGFFEAWKTVVYEYYDRRGQYLGDGLGNGGTAPAADGRFDGFLGETPQPRILIDVTRNAGLDICALIQSDIFGLGGTPNCAGKNIFTRNVSSTFAGKVPVSVGFFTCQTGDVAHYIIRNCLLFTDVPHDLAQRLDTHYDGQPDGQQGQVRIIDAGLPLPNPILVTDYLPFGTTSADRARRYDLVMILQF
jgi:prepilin-type N-terminal cleavage/methylation domain-containing protein